MNYACEYLWCKRTGDRENLLIGLEASQMEVVRMGCITRSDHLIMEGHSEMNIEVGDLVAPRGNE